MKKIIFILTVAVAQLSLADVTAKAYDKVHQSAIAEAITQKCNIYGSMQITASSEQSVTVDNGIADIYYTTQVQIEEIMDQVPYTKTALVKSMKADMYDHNTKDWGSYSVISVECQ